MRGRVDAGTDVAMIGAWDAVRDTAPLGMRRVGEVAAALEADAARAHLFLIHTHADGGGPVEVFADEPIPGDALALLQPVGRERRLALPTGELRIAGAEDYRAPEPSVMGGDLAIPAGDYAVTCYVPRDEEAEHPSEAALRAKVGAANLARYDRINLALVVGGVLTPVVVFPLAAAALGWKLAIPIAIASFVAWFWLVPPLVKRSAGYARLDAVATEHRLRHGAPAFVLALRRLREGEALEGGSVSILELPTSQVSR